MTISQPCLTVRVVALCAGSNHPPPLPHGPCGCLVCLQEEDRVFAGFLLKGFGTSAHVEFSVCPEGGECTEAGFFDILGGSVEMPWQ